MSPARARLTQGLSLAALAAVLALAASAPAEAQFRGTRGNLSAGKTNVNVQQRVVQQPRLNNSKVSVNPPRKVADPGPTRPGSIGATRPPGGGKPTGPVADGGTRPPGASGDGTRPPRPDGRPRPPRGPGWGPIVGPGVVIGTGVAIGTAVAIGSAVAAPPPPPPPSFGGPARGGAGGPPSAGANINIPPQNEQRFVANEVVLEFAGNFSIPAMTDLARRHRLARLDSVSLPSTNSTYFRARIVDGRPVRTVLAGLRNEVTLRSGQPNYIYSAAQDAIGPPVPAGQGATFGPPVPATPQATPVAAAAGSLPALGGDPAQYALSKLRLQEAHPLARGSNVLVAVIDSGVDASHPELRGVIAGTFDALHKTERPHSHGTAMAGAIASRSRLMGVAPAARILAIRAFSAAGSSADATTFAILKGIDHAIAQNARVINMSFAGPADPSLARALATARSRGIVLVAAAGNLGAKAPPQYPAADPNVIAVSATDAQDNLFAGSVRGGHIAVAAPGVDILVPAPNANYDLTTGTSVAAAHVSGVVALLLERRPDLDPEAVRQILVGSARDLGSPGKDEQFGAGLTDPYQAIMALGGAASASAAPPSVQ